MSRRKSKRRTRQSRPNPKKQPEKLVLPKITKEQVTYQGGGFADVEDHEIGIASERQLKLLMRDWRRGRATRTFWDVLTSSYNTIFTIVVLGAMVIGGIVGAQESAAGCQTGGCQTAKTWIPWLLVALSSLLAISISKLFGPVLASSAEGSWLFSAPIRRQVWLRPRLTKNLVVAFLVAGIVSYVIDLLIGLSFTDAAWWAGASAVAATASVALVAAAQRDPRPVVANTAQAIVTLITVVIMLALIAVSVQWIQIDVTPTNTVAAAIIIIGALAGIVLAIIAYRRLATLPRARLSTGSELADAMQGAAFALDFNLMRDILTERKFKEIGQIKPTRGKGIGTTALTWRDAERLVRNPVRVIAIVLALVLPYATQAVGLGVWGTLISAIVLMFVLVPNFDSLRVLTRHQGLARTLPFSTEEIRTATTAVPGIIAFIWSVLAMPAYLIGKTNLTPPDVFEALALGLITGISAFLGAMRWVSSKPPDYSAPLMSTNAGAIPPQLLFNLVRGFDVILVAVLPMVFGLNPWFIVFLLGLMYFFMRQGRSFSQEDMLEASKEAQQQAGGYGMGGYGGGKPVQQKVVTRSKRR